MPQKSIKSLAKKGGAAGKAGKTDLDIRKLAERVQSDLQAKSFDCVLSGCAELEQLKDNSEQAVIYLTSLVWKIRALQGLNRDRDEIETAAVYYGDEARRLGDMFRCLQAMRIRAQLYIDCGQWTQACEHLEDALSLSIEQRLGRQTLELLMHLSALELKMCHYTEAIDYLSRAMNAIGGAQNLSDELREIKAVGYRQLCELYNTVGDGQRACDALESAQNVHSKDEEELWLQELLLSRLDMRSGDADSSCARLKKVEQEIRKAVRDGKARASQLSMVELERAQAMWNHGEYAAAREHLDAISVDSDALPLRQAMALTKFQWAVEMGRPNAEPDEAGRVFSEICNESENTDVQILLAAALTQAAIEIERGHYDATLDSLLHIAQTAAFTQLIPFATRALALRGQINLLEGRFEQAAEDGRDACETFVDHVDDVSARQAGALMLRAQAEQAFSNGDGVLSDNEIKAFEQLLKDFERYESHHHAEAVIDLGLALAGIAMRSGSREKAEYMLGRVEKQIVPEFMAHRQMQYLNLCAKIRKDDEAAERAEAIASLNGYVREK